MTDAQLRFGLIGTGYWAREVHAAGIAVHPDARLVGVWGRDPARAAALASSYDATPFDDLDALLETVDAVAFAVPPDVQAALAPQVVGAGCHVLFEKPLAIGLAAADAVLDAVQAAGVASVVFFTERFMPEREAWLQGLGDCLGAEAHWLGSLQTPNNPFADSPWRKVEGALWDVGPHALAAVLPVLGPVRDIVGATGYGDLVHLVLTHESGATSTLHLSLTMPPAAGRSGLEFYRADGWHARPDAALDAVQAHRNAVGELIATVRAGRTDHRCDARFGRDVVAVLDRAAQVLSS
ncbi:MAG TPA: Gfo/Idh/MocA family oxidoreductase [Jatrophihabitantaceae bacterium]